MANKKTVQKEATEEQETKAVKLAVIDKDGRPSAFFSTDVHTTIPEGAVELTDEQYREFIDNPGERAWDAGNVIKVAPKKPKLSMDHIRGRRNSLLADSDWTQLADSPLSDEKKEAWRSYRQALRDIPESDNPDAVSWPNPPSA